MAEYFTGLSNIPNKKISTENILYYELNIIICTDSLVIVKNNSSNKNLYIIMEKIIKKINRVTQKYEKMFFLSYSFWRYDAIFHDFFNGNKS